MSEAARRLRLRLTLLAGALLALSLLAAICAAAQPTPAEFAAHPERSAGIYRSYEYLPGPAAPVPACRQPTTGACDDPRGRPRGRRAPSLSCLPAYAAWTWA